MLGHCRAVHRRGEARPASTGVELRVRGEERRPATNAAVASRALFIPIGTGERAFGAVLAGDVVLLGRELGAPLGLALRHLGLGLRIGHDQPLCWRFPHTWARIREGTSRTPLKPK